MPIPYPFPWNPLGGLGDLITFIVLIIIGWCRCLQPVQQPNEF
jgi:hypothetical protein